MIRRNLFWKLFALVVAVALWAYVNAERNPQSRRVFSVPIEARNLSKGYVVAFMDSREATVTVQGAAKLVDEIRKEDVSAWVNLRGQSAGRQSAEEYLKVYARVSGIAQGEISTVVSPKKIRVRTEAIKWKRLPVEVKFLSAPPLGFTHSEPEIAPASVAISGRSSAVSRVKKALITVSDQPRGGVIDEEFKVLPVDTKGNVVNDVEVEEATVHLKLRFVEVPARKVVIVSPNVVGQPKFPAAVSKVDVSPATVTLEGKPADLVNLSTISTEPVSIDGAEETVSRSAALRVPSSVRVLGHGRVRVNVHIERPGKGHP